MLRTFAYLDAARHVGDVSYSDYLPFNTGDTTRHLWRFALYTGVQGAGSITLQHWSGQNAFPTVQ